MNNYPDNVDPRSPECPWNDQDLIECEECEGIGKIFLYDDEIVFKKCVRCKGKGEIVNEKD